MNPSPDKRDEDSADATARMLPCPSCGETDVDATFAAGVEREERFYNAGCMVCGMTGPDSHTPRDAADRWNALPRRTTPSHALPIEEFEKHLRGEPSALSTTPRKIGPWAPPFHIDAERGYIMDAAGVCVCPIRTAIADHHSALIADALNSFASTPSATEVCGWREIHHQTGRLSVQEVECPKPIECILNCRMPFRPYQVWSVTDNTGCSTSSLLEGIVKALDGKRVRVAIAVHPDDAPAARGAPERTS